MYDCNKCEVNKSLKKVWGCEEKTQISKPVFEEIERGVYYKYWNCPRRFIPLSILRWRSAHDESGNEWHGFLNLYKYYNKFNATLPDYSSISVRFRNALLYYEDKLTEYTLDKTSKDEAKWQQKYSKLRQG